MTGKSSRAVLFAFVALGATVFAAIVGTDALRHSRSAEAGVPLPFAMYIDCDPAVGIQTSCLYSSGTTTVNVDVIIENNSGVTVRFGAFGFDAITNQAVLTPQTPSCDPSGLNCNPDFDSTSITGSWSCSPPAPNPDADPNPAVADSNIGCFDGVSDGPLVVNTARIRIATVRYNSVNGAAPITIAGGNLYDDSFTEQLSCDPIISVAGDCINAIVQIGSPTPTPTFTPTATQSFTPTNTATPTDTATATSTPTPTYTATSTATSTPTNTATATNTPSVADADGDGLLNAQELLLGTDPFDADTDDDGLSDGDEVNVYGTNPLNADSDGDGLSDGQEVQVTLTNPLNPDSDGDGLSDSAEVNTHNTNPNDTDSDNDGLSDYAEVINFGTDPNDTDSDNDGLDDFQELITGTNPNDSDTDNDGLSDGQEVLTYGTSPFLADTDGDGLSDPTEINTTATNPNDADSDNDGLNDGVEVNTQLTNPNDADSDNDNLTDGAEVLTYLSNPLDPDTDADTMQDDYEVLNACLNVLVNDAASDPDGDAVSNVAELGQLTFPCDPDTDDDGFKDKPSTSQVYVNADVNEDNCILIANPTQSNNDGDFIDLPPIFAFDDLTRPRSDALGDPCDPDDDNDGILDVTETGGAPCASATGATNPLNLDTDKDRSQDGAECLFGTDPTNPASRPPNSLAPDPDNDGLPTLIEALLGTNAAVADTDGDRVLDGVEFRGYASNPLVQDTDGDGCRDAKEVASLNFDRTVNVADLGMVAVHYSPPGGPNYVYELDVNKDGAINAADLGFVAVQTGAC